MLLKACEQLDDAGRTALASDLATLARECDTDREGVGIALPATYLETVLTVS